MFAYSPKCSYIRYSVQCSLYLYDFMTDCLALSDIFLCSSLWKIIFTILCIPWLPVILCLTLRPHELYPAHVSMPIILYLFVSYLCSQNVKILWVWILKWIKINPNLFYWCVLMSMCIYVTCVYKNMSVKWRHKIYYNRLLELCWMPKPYLLYKQ